MSTRKLHIYNTFIRFKYFVCFITVNYISECIQTWDNLILIEHSFRHLIFVNKQFGCLQCIHTYVPWKVICVHKEICLSTFTNIYLTYFFPMPIFQSRLAIISHKTLFLWLGIVAVTIYIINIITKAIRIDFYLAWVWSQKQGYLLLIEETLSVNFIILIP